MKKSIPVFLLFFLILAPLQIRGQALDVDPAQCLGGTPDAPIRLEVYSDFECPACRAFYIDTMRQVLKDYCEPNKVCVVYHEFPLSMHKYSRLAARYSLAAQKVGHKQWAAVVDAMYANQAVWTIDGNLAPIIQHAVSVEDFTVIKKNMLDASIDETINREVSAGEKQDIKSTPTWFIYANGKSQKIVGGVPYSVLKDFFDRYNP